MSYLKSLFFTALLFSFSGTWAANCPLTQESLAAVFETSPFDYRCEYVESLESTIAVSQRIHGLKINEKIVLLVNSEGNNARFDYGTTIEVPYHFYFSDFYGRRYDVSSIGATAIFGHEFGHFLFKGFFLETFPQFKGLFEKFNAISELKVAILKTPLQSKKEKLSAKLSRLLEKVGSTAEFQLYNKITASYSELYADLLSSLVAQDKNALTKALYYNAMNDFEYGYIRTRSFDSAFTEDDERYMSDSHGFFAYTRFHLGQKLWPNDENEAKALVGRIQEAFAKSMKLDFKRGDLLDIREQNEQLISFL